MYQRILVALDGSGTSRRALLEAVSVAIDRRSTLALLHVMSDIPTMMALSGVVDFDKHRQALRDYGRQLLDEAAQSCAALGVAAETHLHDLREGRVSDAVVMMAGELGCGLIVIGTHGRRGVRRALLGSDAESVVRASPVPVLLVHGSAQPARIDGLSPTPPSGYQRILVPVDGSPTSDRGLEEAIRLATLRQSRLRLLHVVDEMSMAVAIDARVTASMDWLGMLREGGAALLRAAERRVREAGLPVDSVLLDNFQQSLPEAVARQAIDWAAELIVIGTHGRRGTERFLLGSDAEKILRIAPVAVLLVRAPAGPDGT